MPPTVTENDLEQAALGWLGELGYALAHGRSIAPGEPGVERGSFGEVALKGRFCAAFARLNPGVSAEVTEDAPDIVLFVNGLPLAVLELKNPADESATARAAFNQLQTYKEQIPSLFVFNESLVASDGMQARIGSLCAGW